MKRRLKIIVPIVALLLLGVAYKTVLAAPPDGGGKVDGKIYVLPKEFVLNLSGGRYAKLTVALVLDEAQAVAAAPPAEGFGGLEQEPLVRQIVTNALTGVPAGSLDSSHSRHGYERRIKRAIDHGTDVEARSVVFTDLVVQ
jgi:flagellar FliL protein